jgi:uncharacterized damage-inducible protein DinB
MELAMTTRANLLSAVPRAAFPLFVAVSLSACEGTQMRSAAPETAGEAAAQAMSASEQPMMDDLLTLAGTAKDKIMGLANAMPEEDYGWAPMDGVRSMSEVFIHIAADNYFIPVIMGVEAPSETGITMDYSTVQAYEAQDRSKAEILEILQASFAHLESAADQTRGDLSVELTFGSNTFTASSLWAQAVTHMHEHLGQSIAYARANEVAPPWSM